MTDNAAGRPRPDTATIEKRTVEVHTHALRLARWDNGVRRRADVDPEDVAQRVALEYFLLTAEPLYLKAWTEETTRKRLIDFARQRQALPADDDILLLRLKRRMGPSAGVVAGIQLLSVYAALNASERELINEHLAGMTNQEIAEAHGYASTAVAAEMISRIKRKLRAKFPDIRFDLEPQRIYQTFYRPPRIP